MILVCGAAASVLAGCASNAAPTTSMTPTRLTGVKSTAAASASAKSTAAASATAVTKSATTQGTPVSTDTAACATGRCEVQVSPPETISFKPGLDLSMLQVTGIKNGMVTIITTSTSDNNSDGAYSAAQLCSANGSNETTTDDMSVGCTVTNNGLSLSVVSIGDNSAVLQLDPTS